MIGEVEDVEQKFRHFNPILGGGILCTLAGRCKITLNRKIKVTN